MKKKLSVKELKRIAQVAQQGLEPRSKCFLRCDATFLYHTGLIGDRVGLDLEYG